MFRSFGRLTHPFFIPVLMTMACSGGQTGGASDDHPEAAGSGGDESGAAGQNEQGEGGRPANTKPSKGGGAGRGGSSGSSGNQSSEAGAGAGGASATGEGGEAGSGGNETVCVSTDSDTPDDDFVDSNCDGIDGDLARAVFVSPDGTDGADGALTTPLRSIDEAIELATSTQREVYVCNGTFIEPVTITTPVAVYGGYDCENGARRTKDRAVVAPPHGVALTIQNVAGEVHVERLAFRAVDGVAPGDSSQAGSIVAAGDVTLSRVEFKAGKGADGKPGAPGADASQVAPFSGAPGGNAPTTQCNLNSMTSACQSIPAAGFDATLTQSCQVNGVTSVQRGGTGGAGANVWVAQNRPVHFGAASVTASGGIPGGGSYLSEGIFKGYHYRQNGQGGAAGVSGADASVGFGSIVAGLYNASNWGTNATDGHPGYPGVGGGNAVSFSAAGEFISTSFYVAAGGGQGGVGGCGGKGALGGGAGGGSIGLVVENSLVWIELSQFITSAGGAGQNGHPGGKGQPGGEPGAAGTAANGAAPSKAQAGGNGGRGGDSGAGAGGPSIGIVYLGTAPAISESTYVIGQGGRGGVSVRNPAVVSGTSADSFDATAPF